MRVSHRAFHSAACGWYFFIAGWPFDIVGNLGFQNTKQMDDLNFEIKNIVKKEL